MQNFYTKYISKTKLLAVLAVIFVAFATVVSGQEEAKPAADPVKEKITFLEKQIDELRAELDKVRQALSSKKDEVAAVAAPEQNGEVKYVKAVAAVPEKNTVASQGQEKKQIGIDLGNNLKLIPYGTIYFNAFGNSAGTNNTDVPLWATTSGGSNVSASLRQTRLGARLEGAKIGRANLSAVVEADFYGGLPAIGIGENFGIVRIRLANAKIAWEKTSVTVGQDWMVFAPNNPTSIASAAIPQMAAAGNPWSRLPQIKVERKFYKNRITWQGAVLAPQTGDFPSGTNTPALLQPSSGAASRVPFFQTRLAFSDGNWFGSKKAGSIGVSAHYGQSRVVTGAINNDIDSAGLALDWNMPLHKRFGITGEAFVGRNLAGFQAGVFQNYNPDFAYRQGSALIAGGVRSIGTRGGWAQAAFTPDVLKDRLTVYGSFGIDDPRNEDLVSLSVRDWRSRNVAYALSLIFKPIPQFSIGPEFRRFETSYTRSGNRSANHFNFAAAYSF
jgi:hypothetical protein